MAATAWFMLSLPVADPAMQKANMLVVTRSLASMYLRPAILPMAIRADATLIVMRGRLLWLSTHFASSPTNPGGALRSTPEISNGNPSILDSCGPSSRRSVPGSGPNVTGIFHPFFSA